MEIVRQTTKIALAWEMYSEGTPVSHIAKHLEISRDTAHRWIREIKSGRSLEKYIDDYLEAKKGPRRKRAIDPMIKRRIYRIREEHNDCCGQKIQYFLERDYGIQLGVSTIYRVLREKYELRSKWKKNQKRGPVPKAQRPRQVVQMDTVDFGNVFAFNSVDIFSKEADVILRSSLTAQDGQYSLHVSMKRRFNGFSDLIQTDGGPEYKAEFRKDVGKYCHRHRYARAYKKNEQSYIESFNRSLRKECLGWLKYDPGQLPHLTAQVEEWLKYYHHERPHMGLGMRPPLES